MPYGLANAIDLQDQNFETKFAELCYPGQGEYEDSYQKFTEQLCKHYPSLADKIRIYRSTTDLSQRKRLETELLALTPVALNKNLLHSIK